MPKSDLSPDVSIKRKVPVWLSAVALSAFGVGFLVYAIPQPFPIQCTLAIVALANFAVAAYVVLRKDSVPDEESSLSERVH